MPNRILREGILTSERVNALGWEAEVFYRRLMSVVDDFGRFSAHPSLLRASLYPLKLDTVRDANLERLLASVEHARLVRVYQVAGKRYLELLDFRQQARAKESKYPPPPSDCESHAQHVHSKSEADAPVFGDGDGDGDVNPPTPQGAGGPVAVAESPPGFAEFWAAYPRKVAKPQAAKAFARLRPLPDGLLDTILSALKAQAESDQWRRENGRFIPHPATWLNARRWEDESLPDGGQEPERRGAMPGSRFVC